MLDYIKIIKKYCIPGSRVFDILVDHGQKVSQKALLAADQVSHLNPDRNFIVEAAMLHDIGMVKTDLPVPGCLGPHPYICHGLLGRVMLEKLGLHRHAMVCERHVGTGLTADDIRQQQLPLPVRDMVPETLEEQIICYADKFYSKGCPGNGEKSVDTIVKSLSRFGTDKVEKFLSWQKKFGSF
jgi:uncharacterized protein